MTETESVKPKTVYRHEVPKYLQWVNEGVQDRMAGSGGLAQVDREIQALAADYPELAPYRRVCSSERRQFEDLLDLGDPNKSNFQTRETIWNEIIGNEGIQIVDEKGGVLDQFTDLVVRVSANLSDQDFAAVFAVTLAYDHYKNCALAAIDGLVFAYKWIGSLEGKDTAVEISGPRALEVVTAVSLLRYEILRGFHRGTVEDKNLLQGVGVGAYALAHEQTSKVTRDEVVELITTNVDAIKWSYIHTQLRGGGAFSICDREATEKFTDAWVRTFGKCARLMETMRPIVQLEVFPQKLPGTVEVQYPFCFYRADKDSWISNAPPRELEPYLDFRYEPEQDESAISLIFGPLGSGKTVVLKSMTAKAVWDGHFVVILKSDKRNQPLYFCLPALGMGREVERRLALMNVKPHPLPTMIVNVIREDQQHLLKGKPLTIFDRVVYIRRPLDFELDFGILVDELKRIRDSFPFPSQDRPEGAVLMVRYLNRQVGAGQANEDLQIAAVLNASLNRWREDNKKDNLDQLWDEITEVAPLEIKGGQSGADLSRVTGQLYETLLVSRGLGMGIFGATVEPKGVAPSILSNANNLVFQNLPTEQMNVLLDKKSGIIQLDNPHEREIVLRQNEANVHGRRMWWYYNRRRRTIELLMTCPPPTCLERKNVSALEAFRKIEQLTKGTILQDYDKINWNPVSQGGIVLARCGTGRQAKLPKERIMPDISALERSI